MIDRVGVLDECFFMYDEDVDWVFHRTGAVLTPAQVRAAVAKLRRDRIAFRDTVPAATPPLVSPCNF